MTVYCCFPGCGRAVYEYDANSSTNKVRSHTVPAADRKVVVQKLGLSPHKARKSQLILCENHFRPDAYMAKNSPRLRRDVPFVDMIIWPESSRTTRTPSPIKNARAPKDGLNKTIAGVPSMMETESPASNFGSIRINVYSKSPAAPSQPVQTQSIKSEAHNSNKNGLVHSPDREKSNYEKKLNFEMKKYRIEATMKYLQREKELEARLKAAETETQTYKAKLDSVQAELVARNQESSSLKAQLDELKKELSSIKSKITSESKQRVELEEKNVILKGDIQFNYELYKTRQERSMKRSKLDKSFEGDESASSQGNDSLSLIVKLRELEEQLRVSNERREAENSAKEKELVNMKKEIKDLHLENQQLYDANIALDMDIRAYRKLVQFEEQRTMVCVKKRPTNDSCVDETDKEGSVVASSSASKSGDL